MESTYWGNWIANTLRRRSDNSNPQKGIDLKAPYEDEFVVLGQTTDIVALSGDAELTRDDLLARVHRYEALFGMTSEQFLERWNKGEIPDTYEANAWAILLDAL